MKRLLSRLIYPAAFAVLTPIAAQAQSSGAPPKDHHGAAQVHGAAWKEMDAFHTLLAATYHPAANDSLQPLRAKADDLASAAKAWASSTPPASCKASEIAATITRLSTDAQTLATRVQANAPDAELKASLSALHDRFETVEGKCGGHGMKH